MKPLRDQLAKLGNFDVMRGAVATVAAYEEGFAPFRTTIANLTLPPRGPKGDPKNINRVSAVASALHKKKLELEGR